MSQGNWTEEAVIRAILYRESSGLSMKSDMVRRTDGKLYRAMCECFGGWRKAVLKAGLNPERISNRRRWTKDMVIKTLRANCTAGHSLTSASIQDTDGGLYVAALKLFGSIAHARDAAGIDPQCVKPKASPWAPATLIAHIRTLYNHGQKVNHEAVRKSGMANAAYRFFGTWDGALEAAGLDPSRVRMKHRTWTKTDVLSAIRQRASAGKPFNVASVRPSTLVRSARRLFGSWPRALARAGVDPSLAVFRRHTESSSEPGDGRCG